MQAFASDRLFELSKGRQLRGLCAVFAILLVCKLSAVQASEPSKGSAETNLSVEGVGTVSLSLGKAYVLTAGQRKEVGRGLQVFVGDRIYTESSGHVHLRFVDDALVSVRPNSSLDITRYDFDENRPENSAVKFELTEGVARSISGKAAKHARQRFRLNTPVAAIGVRGTDFVVSANSRMTRAQVNEGVIVMAPFSEQCSSEALGPCALNAVELASNSFDVIELNDAAVLPAVQARETNGQLGDLNDRFRLSGGSQDVSDEKSDQSDASSLYLEGVATGQVNQVDSDVNPDNLNGVSSSRLVDYTPEKALLAADTKDLQLVWGRFGSAGAGKELISLERIEAAEGRNVTIAASDYLLYRTEENGARVDAGLGAVGFELQSAQAFYYSPSGKYPMRVADGALEVDFIRNQFSTRLDLSSELSGPVYFSGAGHVAPGGYLIGTNPDNSLVGAVSTDGAEAGYFFEQSLESGSFSGLTLWGSQ